MHLMTPGAAQRVWKSSEPSGELSTLMVMVDQTETLPAASVERAATEWAPFESEAVLTLKDHVLVPAGEKLLPSTRAWTVASRTLSEAVPETIVLPDTVVPDVGSVIATVGGVLSRGGGARFGADVTR